MDKNEVLIHIIYLHNGPIILSKMKYSEWREIQDDYDDYMTLLGPYPEEDIIDYFEMEYGHYSKWVFSRKDIHTFVKSNKQVIESNTT